MKRLITILTILAFCFTLFAQNGTKGDARTSNQNVIIKIDNALSASVLADNDPVSVVSPATGNETVNFIATSNGIYINVLIGTNKITLFALTGQTLFNGDLKQGHFFIPVKKGIYFLRINNILNKVICK